MCTHADSSSIEIVDHINFLWTEKKPYILKYGKQVTLSTTRIRWWSLNKTDQGSPG